MGRQSFFRMHPLGALLATAVLVAVVPVSSYTHHRTKGSTHAVHSDTGAHSPAQVTASTQYLSFRRIVETGPAQRRSEGAVHGGSQAHNSPHDTPIPQSKSPMVSTFASTGGKQAEAARKENHMTVAAHMAAKSRQTHSAPSSMNVEMLAHAIQAEAGGESRAAMIAVGDVILNRAHSPEYPNSIAGVIHQRTGGHYAFSCVQNGMYYRPVTSAARSAAKQVLVHHVNIVHNALVFYNPSQVSPDSWVAQQPRIRTIGHLTFAA